MSRWWGCPAYEAKDPIIRPHAEDADLFRLVPHKGAGEWKGDHRCEHCLAFINHSSFMIDICANCGKGPQRLYFRVMPYRSVIYLGKQSTQVRDKNGVYHVYDVDEGKWIRLEGTFGV